MSAMYKGLGRWGEEAEVGGWVGGLTLPVDTANQVVCPAGQIDGNTSL